MFNTTQQPERGPPAAQTLPLTTRTLDNALSCELLELANRCVSSFLAINRSVWTALIR